MRIARFTTDDDPRYAVMGTDDDGRTVLAVLEGDPFYRALSLTGEKIDLDDARLLAPVIPRSKVVGVGRNYAAHARELGNEAPAEPLLFLKPNTAVAGPGDPIVLPPQTAEVSHEAELAVVIGRICKDVPADRVADVIFGYTVANDVTARDLQRSDDQWARAKGFDTFCPLGPWIETDIDVTDLAVTSEVGEELRQDGRTSAMIHDVPSLIAYISAAFTLLPGDVVLTGTPAGVGPLVPGDQVRCTVEGIGTLSNPVVSGADS